MSLLMVASAGRKWTSARGTLKQSESGIDQGLSSVVHPHVSRSLGRTEALTPSLETRAGIRSLFGLHSLRDSSLHLSWRDLSPTLSHYLPP
ncbi:hypothetical protein FA13DRAFT_816531 [Coprinellus micaceus]|uniref:Uncharacterized protein n=1 Tax=Coprinellus micaceus TaxID=71717 RepID=A0A4Y7T2L6_COPMI|nr:hypothetical protein FA13DRAFT_816531 [Coprinellus micaceus]